MNGDSLTRQVETVRNAMTSVISERVDTRLISYESFLGFGFEGFVIGVIAALAFGTAVGATTALNPIIAGIFLFVAYAVPLTGSTHYDPRLGTFTAAIFLAALRAAQLYLGVAPATYDFIKLALILGVLQVFLIGYLPGKLIPTSEHLGFLAKGMTGIAVLYSASEYFVWQRATELGFASVMLAYPVWSFFLIAGTSSVATFIFANTFCPYMMIPIMSRNNDARYCGSGNYIFDIGTPVKLDKETIELASKRGFKLVSELPSVTVFSCPRGGLISVYRSGKMLIRKVNKGTASRINRNLVPLFRTQASF